MPLNCDGHWQWLRVNVSNWKARKQDKKVNNIRQNDTDQKKAKHTGEKKLCKEIRVGESGELEALHQLPGLDAQQAGRHHHEKGVVVEDPILV